MAKNDKPVMRCDLHHDELCGSVLKCRDCGWWPAEIARRKQLPLVQGPDGLYRKHVGKKRPDEPESD